MVGSGPYKFCAVDAELQHEFESQAVTLLIF